MIVRSDLPKGVLAAHIAHAASEASGHPPTIVVALAVDGETELRRVAAALVERSLTHRLVVEDAGPFSGQATALGIVPTVDREAIRKVVSDLPLVR